MQRILGIHLLVLCSTLPQTAAGASLQDARQRWLRGNYEEARSQYEALAKEPANRVPAALGLSRTWQSQGEYDKALSVVDTALAEAASSAPLHARRSEVLYLRGRWEDAEKAAEKALALDANHFLARWVRAQVYRDRGDLKRAEAEFRWFVRTYSDRSEKDSDIKDPDDLLLIGLAGSENARWNSLADQFPFILNEVYADALRHDKDLWQAEYLAGTLLLEKYNRGEALTAFDKALTINASAAEVLTGKGVLALQKYEIKDADEFAGQALRINPNLPDARRLRADICLATGDVPAALRELERARKINPRDELTVGRVAACFALSQQKNEYEQIAKEVERHNPKPGLFWLTLAEQMEARRRFDEAEKLYLKAMDLRPMLAEARNGLGLLYMRLGRETEAREVLLKAFESDSYNVRVSNMLKVLRHLDKYETLTTPHFKLCFDPRTDRHLARHMAKSLEEMYSELAKKFQYRPTGPILIEVFNNHEMFSGRTVALPDLHTIGACTGRMIAMVSPRGKDIRKPFNWARVLRHELVHIFNLEQTRFLVPHWFTEGLAVENEGFPRPQVWNEILLKRVPAGNLLTLDDIDLGFIRPRSPEEWNLAYCQSQLYIEYLKKNQGPGVVGGLLNAFGDGLDTTGALQKVCNVDKASFEKGYREFLAEKVKDLRGRPIEKPVTFAQLQRAHEENPDDPDLAAQLAEQCLNRRRTAEARKLADMVLAKQKNHAIALLVKSRLLAAGGEEEESRKLLEAALDRKSPEPKVLAALGKACYENKDFVKAAEVYELAHKVEPYESKWLVELVRVHAQAGDKDRQIEALKKLVPMDADDLALRKRLARMLLEGNQPTEAERYARQALEIDVLDTDVQLILADALLQLKKADEAIETYKMAVELDDKSDAPRLKLARAYLLGGRKQEAGEEISKVLGRDPDNEEAKRLQKLLQQ